MAFTIFQAGSTLYGMDQNGSQVSLTLPTGVTIDSNQRLRSTVFGNYAVMVNSPSMPITCDANLNVRPLCPRPPSIPPTVAASSGSGTLSGTFSAKQTYRIYDAFGRLIAESDYGPESSAVSITSKKLAVSGLQLSSETISSHGLYRTTDGTSTYFKWLELDGNTQTSIEDDLSDAGLSTFAAPFLGTPPDMYLIAEFRSRLFGVSKGDTNSIRYSEVGAMYAWPGDNQEPAPRIGSDRRGITGLMRRRDSLGVGRANGIYAFTGTTSDDFRFVNISENCGIEATDSIAVFRDVAYFLWKDGVYRWDADGVHSISDNRIRRWFISNDTFNLSRIQNAFGIIDPFTRRYKLFLASAGSTVEDCWIEYDIENDKWWGPHQSHAFNPSSAFYLASDSGMLLPIVGGTDGYIRRERKRRKDDEDTGIDFDVVTTRLEGAVPNDTKYFGECFIQMKNQPEGTMEVQSVAGDADELRVQDNIDAADHINMQQSHARASRIGVGQAAKVRFRNNASDVDVNLREFEIAPVSIVGKR